MKALKNNIIMIRYVIKFCPMYVISSLLFIIFSSVSMIAEVLVIERVISLVMTDGTTIGIVLNSLIKYLIVIGISLLVTRFHQSYLQPRYRHLWVKKIQRVMFEKAASLDIACFDDPKTYDLFTRALREGDIKGINTFDTFVRFMRNVVIILTLGTYIIFQDILLLILVVVQSTLSFIISSKITKMWYKANREQEKNYRLYSYINRVFYLEKHTLDVKTTNLSNLLVEKQAETKGKIDDGYRPVENKGFILNSIEDVFYQVVRNFGGYVYLIWKVYEKKSTIAAFSATINAVFKFTGYLYGIVGNFVSLRENAMYIDDFLWLMRYKPEVEGRGGKQVNAIHPTIEISDLSFKYPNQEDYALKNVNLMLKPQEKVAIIGYNGAGKTTLIKLLLKFYDPETGTIKVDNQEYQELDGFDIRRMYSSIFQNFQIYSVTVLENVLLRRRESEEDDVLVWEALEKSGLASKIRECKHGLDTILTKEFKDDGLMLSGGERQKLAIARIFASSAPIIILDEPTSALDPISEYQINKRILNLCEEKTIVLISHRLSTVVDANKIYMFADGEIVEAGSHSELMSIKGKYYEMFTTQAKLYQS